MVGYQRRAFLWQRNDLTKEFILFIRIYLSSGKLIRVYQMADYEDLDKRIGFKKPSSIL